jgi:hypothetical protein
MEAEVGEEVGFYFGDIFLVGVGEEDIFYAGADSGEELFFDAADGEDFTAQGDFAGHS